MPDQHHPAAPPLVGVSYVMPVLNDATHVRAAVESILAQDYTGPVEVLIALGPSIDGTAELVADLAARDARVRVLENEVGSTPAGLNIGIRAARYPGGRAGRLALDAADRLRPGRGRRARPHRSRQRGRDHGRPGRDAVRAGGRTRVHDEGGPRRIGVPRRRRRGARRDRVPRRVPPGGARTGRPLRRDHQARPGLGAEPPPARDRRHGVVHARARGDVPAAFVGRAARPADVLHGALARRARAPIPGGERHPLLRPAGDGRRRRPRPPARHRRHRAGGDGCDALAAARLPRARGLPALRRRGDDRPTPAGTAPPWSGGFS